MLDYVASKCKGQNVPVGWPRNPSQGGKNFMAGGAQIKHTEESEVRTAIWDVATSPPYHRGKTSAGRIMNEVLRKSRGPSQEEG